eukprot:scaffold6241_cov78-Skeletonema_dohrnii-CCMP3373.AAC.3
MYVHLEAEAFVSLLDYSGDDAFSDEQQQLAIKSTDRKLARQACRIEVDVQKMEQYDTARRKAGDQAGYCVDWSGGSSKSYQNG